MEETTNDDDNRPAPTPNNKSSLQLKKHVKFMQRMVGVIPNAYSALDSSRMTILFFALSGLDVMNSLDIVKDEKDDIIKWIYAQQVIPSGEDNDELKCGFRGAPSLGGEFDIQGCCVNANVYECGHVAMTYTALCCLIILGDDLSRVNKKAIINGLKSLQLKDGSFMPVHFGSENDTRFIYCACCISYMLNDWSGINADMIIKYIRNSLSYDHGIGQGPGLEAHGGSTYCALASLVLLNKLQSTFNEKQIDDIKRWCLFRQKSGFQGRPNKPVDTCYSFWVGASLKLLGIFDMINQPLNRDYLLDTQHSACGGFSKWPDFHPDVLHTYFGLCGLSLLGEKDLAPVHAALNITERAKEHLSHLHQLWSG
eukprot:gene9860-10871_t